MKANSDSPPSEYENIDLRKHATLSNVIYTQNSMLPMHRIGYILLMVQWATASQAHEMFSS